MTDAPHIRLGRGREFDVIEAALVRWGPLAAGVGDDCAVLDVPPGDRLVMSLDTALEDVHFRRAWLTPEETGYRATAAAISDLAAMAATPLGVAVALTLPESWRGDFLRLCDGIGDAVRVAGARIVGGDLTRGDRLSLSVTVLGYVHTPLTRAGARPGDVLYVTGRLGGPVLALEAWDRGMEPRAALRERFAHPVPRLAEARWLADQGATSGMDVSDGVVSEASHLAAAGGVRVVMDLDRLPVVPGATVDDAARSGEEYELVVTAPAGLDTAEFERSFGLPLTAIGAVEPQRPGSAPVETRRRGERVEPPRGHDHFSHP
ncbi:MAG: thiamine-phosphate kinase [Gemmatimonadaceae bacterium]